MHFVQPVLLGLFCSIPLVSSVAVDLEKRVSDVAVTLSSAGGTVIKASVKNNGAEALKFLKSGTFLDTAPVDKATVFKDGVALAFKGVLRRTKTAGLTEEAFASLAPGATLESTFDIAAVTDLSAGGSFEVIAEGAVPLATAGSTTLSGGKLVFRSNKLSVTVDGAAAARVAPAIHLLDDRTILTSCTTAQRTTMQNVLSRAVTLATNAANAAASGSSSKFYEYYRTTASTARSTVAARFRGVVTQASSSTSGTTRYYCTDPYGYCDPK